MKKCLLASARGFRKSSFPLKQLFLFSFLNPQILNSHNNLVTKLVLLSIQIFDSTTWFCTFWSLSFWKLDSESTQLTATRPFHMPHALQTQPRLWVLEQVELLWCSERTEHGKSCVCKSEIQFTATHRNLPLASWEQAVPVRCVSHKEVCRSSAPKRSECRLN